MSTDRQIRGRLPRCRGRRVVPGRTPGLVIRHYRLSSCRETLVEGETGGPRGTLERLRPEPADLLPQQNDTRITGFRLSLFKSMGSSRGNAESGFIRSVDDAVHRFHSTVVVHLDRLTPRQAPAKESTGTP